MPRTKAKISFYEIQDPQGNVLQENIRGMTNLFHRDIYEKGNWKVIEKPFTKDQLIENLHIHDFLGKGSFGSAFQATLSDEYDSETCVVKLPNEFLRVKLIRIEDSKIKMHDPTRDPIINDVYTRGQQDFYQEYENAMSILRPHVMGSGLFDKRHNMRELHKGDFNALRHEALTIQRHRGYKNIHKVIHCDLDICCIISEYCDGTLDDVLEENASFSRDSQLGSRYPDSSTNLSVRHPNTKKLIIDIGHAVQYLRDVAEMSHMDIKPNNIFYKRVQGSILWKIADFGVCEPCNEYQQRNSRILGGTCAYYPECVQYFFQENGVYNNLNLMIHCYAATIFEVCCAWYKHKGLNTSTERLIADMYHNVEFIEVEGRECLQDIIEDYIPPLNFLFMYCFSQEYQHLYLKPSDETWLSNRFDEIIHKIEFKT